MCVSSEWFWERFTPRRDGTITRVGATGPDAPPLTGAGAPGVSVAGGVSEGIYAGLNCGAGSRDDPEHVLENKTRVMGYFGVSSFLRARKISRS